MRKVHFVPLTAWMVTGLFISSVIATAPTWAKESELQKLATDYVKFCLKLEPHDPGFVDAYIGPKNWQPKPLKGSEKPANSLADLSAEVAALISSTQALSRTSSDPNALARLHYLEKSLIAAQARVAMVDGKIYSFDEESKLLSDAVAPTYSDRELKKRQRALDQALPGKGDLTERFNQFRAGFVVPPEKLDAVFKAAILEAQRRTLKYIKLPKNERFTVAYVTGKSWSAYNWYQGNFQSRIEVNIDQPLFMDRILVLASHEGYPGHHVQNILREKLYRDKKWVEFSVYPLYNPSGLFLEGAADYGVAVAFPDEERIDFEAQVLYPLAGLDPARAGEYHRITAMREELNGNVRTEVARRLLDGKMSEAEAVAMIEKLGLETKPLAERAVKFFKNYRSYTINYDFGEKMVHDYVENQIAHQSAGQSELAAKRWALIEYLFSTPLNPSDLLVRR